MADETDEEMVTQNGLALKYVPKVLSSEALCLAAVRQNEKALEYVPEELREEVRRKINNGTI